MAIKTSASIFSIALVWLIHGLPKAAAESMTGMAEPRQLGFSPAATETMARIDSFHDFLLVITTLIVILVTTLLVVIVVRFNRRANPVPSKTSHNTLIEIIWTIVPVLILVAIAVPSFRLLYFQDVVPEADMVIKASGHQWYWSYEYPDHDGLSFESIMLPSSYFDDDLPENIRDERDAALADLQRMLGRQAAPQIHRLLDTDNRVVVPVGRTVKVLVTAADVLHSWAIPAFGIKIDAVPGRMNETWFKAEKTGTFYGQCSELCGIRHAFMPIVIEVVSEEEFEAWLARARTSYALGGPAAAVRLALSTPTQ